VSSVSSSNLGKVFWKKYFASVRILIGGILKIQNENVPGNYFKIGNEILQFFSSSVTYPAMGMGPLLLECHGAIDNLTMSPRFV